VQGGSPQGRGSHSVLEPQAQAATGINALRIVDFELRIEQYFIFSIRNPKSATCNWEVYIG
jgi:hypothetical protein